MSAVDSGIEWWIHNELQHLNHIQHTNNKVDIHNFIFPYFQKNEHNLINDK